jgi:phosphoribosylamine---glycine ligase
MKVLIVGGGGREHALAWKCAQEARVSGCSSLRAMPARRSSPSRECRHRRRRHRGAARSLRARAGIALTIVGPEGPLVAGIVDRFAAAGLRCFGPTRAAARLEGSKAYTKDFLKRHGYRPRATRRSRARTSIPQYLRAQRLPLVVKADGLAAGKGVVICETHERRSRRRAACSAVLRIRRRHDRRRGVSRRRRSQLHRDRHDRQVLPLATSQDHKRRDDGDRGPNTGGMGAYSPAPIVTPDCTRASCAKSSSPRCADSRGRHCPTPDFCMPAS